MSARDFFACGGPGLLKSVILCVVRSQRMPVLIREPHKWTPRTVLTNGKLPRRRANPNANPHPIMPKLNPNPILTLNLTLPQTGFFACGCALLVMVSMQP